MRSLDLIPYWVWERRQNKMLVTELLRKVVVFVGHNGIRGEGDFCADGTGFMVCIEAHGFLFAYAVTAKHVIDQAAGPEGKRDVLLRINTKAGGFEYLPTKSTKWQLHPDHVEEGRKRKYIDVAVYGLLNYREWAKINLDKYDFTYLKEEDFCTEETIKKYAIGIGDEVAIPSLFLSHLGTTQNIPIVRTGNVAAMRSEPVPTSYGPMDAYLVEMRSVGGISGSPVVTHMAIRPKVMLPESPNVERIEQSPKTHYLLGLVHGHYTITTQDEWVFKTDQTVGDINAGIAIVVPASQIMDIILKSPLFIEDYEMAKAYRENADRSAKSVADSAPTVAPTVESEDDDANPNHLKDFARLVDVAARKKPKA